MSRRLGRGRQGYVLGAALLAVVCVLLFSQNLVSLQRFHRELTMQYPLRDVPLVLPASYTKPEAQAHHSTPARILVTGGIGNIGASNTRRFSS